MEVIFDGTVSRPLPQYAPDQDDIPVRLGRYQEMYNLPLVNTSHNLSDEGSYFSVTNPTPGTGIAYGSAGTQASFSATTGFMVWKNTAASGDPSAKRIYLHYVKVVQIGGTAPASNTSVQYAFVTDSGNRVPTANASFFGPGGLIVPSNQDVSTQSVATFWTPNAGVPTVPAAISPRLCGRGQMKGGARTLLDSCVWCFGALDNPGSSPSFAAAGKFCENLPPIILGPQEFGILYLWFPAGVTNPFTFEFEAGWWER